MTCNWCISLGISQILALSSVFNVVQLMIFVDLISKSVYRYLMYALPIVVYQDQCLTSCFCPIAGGSYLREEEEEEEET